MSDYVFPQFNDYDDPQNFAFHLGQSNLGDFVEYGLSLTADHSAETFDLSEGKAYVEQTDAVGDASGETRHRLVYAVHVDATADVGFATTSGVNYVWLDANVGSQDSPQIVVETNDTAPSDASLKLGSIDAANDTAAVETNREPEADFAATTFSGDVAFGANRITDLYQIQLVDDTGTQRWTINHAGNPEQLRFVDENNTSILGVDTGGPATVFGTYLDFNDSFGLRDASDVERFIMDNGETRVKMEDGNDGFVAAKGVENRANAYSDTPFKVLDQQGGFDGFSYLSSASAPGILELSNSFVERPIGTGATSPVSRVNNNYGQAGTIAQATEVSTTTKTILDLQGIGGSNITGGLVVVTGRDRNDGSNFFADILVVASDDGGVTVINSQERIGPHARSYSVTNDLLELSMGSSTYTIQATSLLGRNTG